jgi:hypothetical protein
MKALIVTLIFILSISVIFISCSNDPVTPGGSLPETIDSSSFVYPFTDGDSWSVKRTMSFENPRPDSIRHYFTGPPVVYNGYVSILYDTIINGITTKCFFETETEGSSVFENRLYYYQTDTGFYCLANRNYMRGFGYNIPFKKNNLSFEKYGIKTQNLFALEQMLINRNRNIYSDTFIVFSPPVLSLKYPVIKNTEWFFLSNFFTVYKKYTEFVNLTVGGQKYSCIKTQRRYEGWDDLIFYEYYSKYGQLQSDHLFKNNLVTTLHNPDGIGYVDMREKIEVLSFNVTSK